MRYEDLIAAARIARRFAAALENRLPRDMSTREVEEAILEAERVANLLEAEAASEPTETGRDPGRLMHASGGLYTGK